MTRHREEGLALDFNAVSLTPLTDDHIRALEYLTSGWSHPHRTRGASSSTMGPDAYRRRRGRIAAVAAGVMAAVVLLVPGVIAAVALYQGDSATLAGFGEALPYLVIAAAVLAAIGAAISWFQTSGKRRTNAGAEPATQLTFAATTSGLVVTSAAGGRMEAPWRRWRIANVRSQIAALEQSKLYILDSVDLVIVGDDGPSTGSVTLDPETLTDGRDFAATILGMIAQGGRG
jgi:hypothetical protein